MSVYPIGRHAMLRRTFVHLPGVGPRTERHLWRHGVDDWEKLATEAGAAFGAKRREAILSALDVTFDAWTRGDLYYFDRSLPGNERWRLVLGAEADIAYFDIEATGGSFPPYTQSTAVAVYFRGELLQEHDYRRKRDLLEHMLAESSLLCTYNGAGYDVPFLRAEYAMPFAKAHVDLCPWLRRLGLKGGLKAIQRALAHLPQRDSMDIDGFDAVRLWRLHEQGVPGALETLLTYNAEDALILAPLLVEALEREAAARPDLGIVAPAAAPLPPLATAVDPRVYAMLRATTSYEAREPVSYLERWTGE